ncbi:hypothetical protein ebA2910 [Aromatoleum aromaticum EbN1]|uniref:Uncharacterized protein n=1 Tax=Aromatoleum aromaticum (strain DSM 19018 / LMG 30748 / EbN1) TaxID=76114 RepID=Q5P4J9_AROAE|nr:hypothetical protein ebA2910 [Aromatoleum aromaticum EbN1]
MKHPEYLDDFRVAAMQIGDAIVAVENHAHFTFRHDAQARADVGKGAQQFRLGDDAVDHLCCGRRIIRGDVAVDIFQPIQRLGRPSQFRHERILRTTSSWLTLRPARASAKPRSTMPSKASSRMISSKLASSGCASITSRNRLLALGFSFTCAVISHLLG